MNKKGLSAIVTTLIIVLLVLAAIAIVWTPIKNLIQGGTDDLTIDCFEIEIDVVSMDVIDAETIDVTFQRGAKGADSVKTKVVFGTDDNSSSGIEGPALAPLQRVKRTFTDAGLGSGISPTKVTVYAVGGNGEVCTGGSIFEL